MDGMAASGRPVAGEREGRDILTGLGENIFAAVAPRMVRNGWSIFPQQAVGSRRFPGSVNGESIKWREDHNLAEQLPTPEAIRSWCLHCPGLNVACVFGPGSGHAFALDIDVRDRAMSDEIVRIAFEILGETPFRRVGRVPKIALVYRSFPDETIPSTSKLFAETDADGNAVKSIHGLEILSAGKPMTFHGRHHETGQYFTWIGGANPLVHGPERAPQVSVARLVTFLEAVDSRFRFFRNTTGAAAMGADAWTWDPDTTLHIPRIRTIGGETPWSTDDEGRVWDGREAYVTAMVFMIATGNARRVNDAVGNKEMMAQCMREFAAAAEEEIKNTVVIEPSGRWSAMGIQKEVRSKVTHLLGKVERGETKLSSRHSGGGAAQPPQADLVLPGDTAANGDYELSFLPGRGDRDRIGRNDHRRRLKGHFEPPPADHVSLEIPEDRSGIAAMIQGRMLATFTSFFGDVYAGPEGLGEDRRSRIHILPALVGAGKTSGSIAFIAADPRTKQDYPVRDKKTGRAKRDEYGNLVMGRCPIGILMPTYRNIEELRQRAMVIGLDGKLPDDQLKAAAEAIGIVFDGDVHARLEDLRRDAKSHGLNAMIYSGKLRAGCRAEDKVRLAMDAGIGTSSFCKAKVIKDQKNRPKGSAPEYVEEICPFYEGCPAIEQRAMIASAHVVLMPHSFLALSIPEELSELRAVIADERIHHLFLHTATFSASTLGIGRAAPRLTKKEKAAGIDANALLADREAACGIVRLAFSSGECPATALDAEAARGGADGLALVKAAKRVCGSAIQKDQVLSPATPIAAVRELCARPTGFEVREELRFWTILEERIQGLRQDGLRNETELKLIAELAVPGGPARHADKARSLEIIQAMPRRACGEREFRIQHLVDNSDNGDTAETIRISWREKPNWPGVPVLLLDASAAPPIIAKIWQVPEAEIVVHDIVDDVGRAFNVKIVGVVDRTFSNSSVVGSATGSKVARMKAGKLLAKVRLAVSTIASMHGDGHFVLGTSIIGREALNRDWAGPANMNSCHFGAMRGLDQFKNDAAAVSIGRMEPPVRTVDGLVAALCFDDQEPELPHDVNGDGMDPADPNESLRLPMGDQRVRLRSGHVAVLQVPVYPGRWARLMQKQYREEEQQQFVGRLRPVYRTGRTPVWYVLSSIIPEGLIADDLISLDDLLNTKTQLWDAVRRTGGVAEPSVLAAACPENFRNGASSAEADMVAMGFDMTGGAPLKREAEGFASWRWRAPDGSEGIAFAWACLDDAADRIKAAMSDLLGQEVADVALVRAPKAGKRSLARLREPDAVEVRIGPAESRGILEERCIDEVGKLLLDTVGQVDMAPGVETEYPFMESAWDGSMTAKDVGAYLALEKFWKGRAGAADDRLMPVVPDGPADIAEGDDVEHDFGHLAASSRDGDFAAAA